MINIKEKLVKKAKKFPNSQGIYWFSKKGKRIYVGKAGSLKKRISSYFRTQDFRISEMVKEADNISFKKTMSVLEATILEANVIKKYWPQYNIKEKDNRSFVYLVITKEDFPRPFIARAREIEKFASRSYIFGPYQSYRILKIILNLVRKVFPFSNCKPNSGLSAGRQGKPCFDYQIDLCPGVCVGAVTKTEYQKIIKNLNLFFRGDHRRLFKELKKENPEKIFALKHIEDVALITANKVLSLAPQRIEGYDISHFGGKDPVGAMAVFVNGFSDTSQYRLFKIKSRRPEGSGLRPQASENTKKNFDDLAMLSEILERRFNHREWQLPDIILIDGGRNQVARAKKVLSELNIFIPIVGIAKILGHSGRAYSGDKLFFANIKPSVKKLLFSSRQLFQQVRNEAHRFAISFQRKQRKL